MKPIFETIQLPGPKNESWHYTDLKKFVKQKWYPIQSHAEHFFPSSEVILSHFTSLILNNGYITPSPVEPKKINMIVKTLASALSEGVGHFVGAEVMALMEKRGLSSVDEHDSLIELKLKSSPQGVCIFIPLNSTERIHLQSFLQPFQNENFGGTTVLILVSEGADCTIFDDRNISSGAINSDWLHIEMEKNSRVELIRKNAPSTESLQIGLVTVAQKEASCFNGFNLSVSQNLIRETWIIEQLGEYAESHLSGIQFVKDSGHSDWVTSIRHQAPKGVSSQKARVIAADQSRGIFSGKIVITKGSQNVDSSQLTQGLLFGEKAEIYAKPQLEIFADDVKAGHGASVGQIDEEELFYLMSRGIPKDQAEVILGEGFARASADLVQNEELKTHLHSWLRRQMESMIYKRGLS